MRVACSIRYTSMLIFKQSDVGKFYIMLINWLGAKLSPPNVVYSFKAVHLPLLTPINIGSDLQYHFTSGITIGEYSFSSTKTHTKWLRKQIKSARERLDKQYVNWKPSLPPSINSNVYIRVMELNKPKSRNHGVTR